MNGHITVTAPVRTTDGTIETRQFQYELGDSAFFVENKQYELRLQEHLLSGDVTAPALTIKGATTRAGHAFRFQVELTYRPSEDLTDGVPYGFRFTTGTIHRVGTQPGDDYSRALQGPSDFVRTVRAGEDEFVRAECQAARFTAVVDQAAAAMRDQGER